MKTTSLVMLTISLVPCAMLSMVRAAETWEVHNDLDEGFTVYVWPQRSPKQVQWKRIPANLDRAFPLGEDDHEIEVASDGGYVYVLDAMMLKGVGKTDLSTIITPKGKKSGRIYYAYMNQSGFNANEASDLIEDVSRSTWSTTYATSNGGRKETELSFTGHGGAYDNGRGKLTQVTYQYRAGKVIIRGFWSYNQSKKREFQFFVDEKDPNRFSSNEDGSNSLWDGTR